MQGRSGRPLHARRPAMPMTPACKAPLIIVAGVPTTVLDSLAKPGAMAWCSPRP